jgi:hypothetical protein
VAGRKSKQASLPSAPAPERTINISDSDSDVFLENNLPPTQAGLTVEARAVAANEPTDPGALRRRLKLRRSIAVAIAGGLGVVVLWLTVRGFMHGAPATAGGPPVASATAVPAASSSPPPPAAPPAGDAIAATPDSVSPPSRDQPPAASAPAKNTRPRMRSPSRPKSGPSKVR